MARGQGRRARAPKPPAPPGVDRFRGRAVRVSQPWLDWGEWRACNPIRFYFAGFARDADGEEPRPGDVLPAFVGRLAAGDEYVLDTSLPESTSAAALLLLGLEERPAYLLRGTDAGYGRPVRAGVLGVSVREAELLERPVRIDLSGVEGFFDEALSEARELLGQAAAVLTRRELRKLATKMYDIRPGALTAAFEEVALSRERARRREVAPAVSARERAPLYIRFGDVPESGRSRGFAGGWERGVSCFRARLEAEPGGAKAYVIDAGDEPLLLEQFKTLAVDERREPRLLTGREIGVGDAGEPLLDGAGVRLERMRDGSRVRVTGEWQDVVTLNYAVAAMRGFVFPPHIWRPQPVITVRKPALKEPARSVAAVLEAVLSPDAPIPRLEVHGEDHPKRVAVAGARLCEETPGADRMVVLLFALLHDAARLRDFVDEHHPYRGSLLARDLLEGGDLVSEGRLKTLRYAIEHHTSGETSEDPTVGVCWDADRLNLWRVGVRPRPEFLSTQAAGSPGMIEWGRELQHEHFRWEEVMEAYDDVGNMP